MYQTQRLHIPEDSYKAINKQTNGMQGLSQLTEPLLEEALSSWAFKFRGVGG
jgi:hypothetical protein